MNYNVQIKIRPDGEWIHYSLERNEDEAVTKAVMYTRMHKRHSVRIKDPEGNIVWEMENVSDKT